MILDGFFFNQGDSTGITSNITFMFDQMCDHAVDHNDVRYNL